MADLTEVEKARNFFDGCHRAGASDQDMDYYIGVLLSDISLGNAGGGLTDIQLRASAVAVSGPLTDAQLRAAPVPVSGTVIETGPTVSMGVAGARFTSADQSAADAAITDAPTLGQKIVLTDIIISVGTTMKVSLKEETSGTVLADYYIAANNSINISTQGKFKLATANKKLMVRASVAGNIAVTPLYYSEA